MVRQVRMGGRPEAEVEPELTSLDQLTQEERRQIAARMPAGGQPRAAAPPPAEPAKAEPAMTRRSWYAEKDASDALARAVDDLHFATREPKHRIVSALFRHAADHPDAVLGYLRNPEEHP